MKVFSVAFFCISALLLTGCFSTSEPRKIETKLEQGVQVSEAELAKTGEAYLRQVVAALEKNDHAKFTEHNIPEYNRMVTKEVFRKIAEDFRKTHGKMGEPQYLGCINKYSGKILRFSLHLVIKFRKVLLLTFLRNCAATDISIPEKFCGFRYIAEQNFKEFFCLLFSERKVSYLVFSAFSRTAFSIPIMLLTG